MGSGNVVLSLSRTIISVFSGKAELLRASSATGSVWGCDLHQRSKHIAYETPMFHCA